MESQEDGGPEPIVWKRISSAVESDSGRLEAGESLPNETETSTDGESDPKRLKTDESSIPKESTTNGEAVPVSEAAKRQNMIETELNGMIKEMMDSEDFQEEDEMEPESYEAIMKAAKEICYTRKIYDVSADKIVFFPSITKTIVNMDLFEKAEEYYYDEGDEFPMEYSMGLRNVAFEKLEAEGEDDDDEEMDDDMMERLSMAVQLTEDDKDELQEAIAAAEAADEEGADEDNEKREDSVMDPVTEAAGEEEEDQGTDENEDSAMDTVNEVTDQEEAEQDIKEDEDSVIDPISEATDHEEVEQGIDNTNVSAIDPIDPLVDTSSAIPEESTTSAAVSNGEAVPVSEAAKRQNMIDTELNGMIKEMMDSEDFQEEDEMEPESYEAIMKAAKEICYTRKIYDVSADKIVFFPSITKTIVNMDLFEKAEEYYYDEGDEFPMEYSMGLRNVAFEKLEAEGEDDDDEEMDDDMMERLSMAVQLTEDDKDELQEAIAAAEAADKDEADQDGAMDPVTEAADEEEAEGEMGSKEDSAMNTVTEITDQEKEDRYTDEKDDSVMDLVNEVTDQDEANQDTGEKEDATNDPIIEISHRNEQDMGQSEDSGMDPVNEVTDQEDVDQETDEKEVSAADPIGPQVESFSASPTEITTSATVSTGEAVPVSEATKRQNMIETELNGMIKEMMDSEDFQEEDEMEPESYEAIMKAAKEICYTRKIYDVSADKIVFFPSITKTIVNMDLFEKAEEYYYDEGDEFPMEYSMGLRNVAFEKLEAEGEDDDDEEMDDDMMERLSMAVQLTEDDKDELQEAIAAAEAADKEEADQDGAMDPVTEAADEEEAEGEMGSTEDSAMNTVTEITDQEKEDRYTDEKDDSVMDLVNEVTDQDEANQDTGEKEDATNDPIIEISHRNEQDMGQSEDSGMDPVNEVTDQEDVDQETDEKEVSAADPIGPQVESFSASPTEITTSATVSTGEAVPVSEATKRQNMIETELNGMIKEMMDSEDFQEEDEMEPESYEAIMKAAKEICYTRKIYDVSADKIVFFPSITKTIVNMDLFEKAEEYYYDEGDEFPMEYSMGLRNVAFEKLEAEGEDDDDEEMDDDMMERLSMAVQLTEDDKDELQEAIAAAEAADKEEADQDGAMDPVTEAADEEEAEGEMGSTEDSAMNTVTEITDQEKEDRYTDEKDDSVMDLVNEVTDQDEANQDTGEKEDATNDPIIEISHRNEQDMGQSEDSGMDPVNEVTDQEDVDQETDEKEVSAADPIGPQVESFSASPTEITTSATVSTGEAVPVSEATKRQNMIETELNGMIKEMMDSEDFQEEDEMEPESYEAIMKAAKEICYTRKIYDVSADKIVFFPSITKTIVNMDLFEKAEEYYYDEGDEFPMEYSMGLRNVAFEKLEAEGEDDDDEEMDDDMMERLSMAVQLTEDDKDELQEAIAAAEAADKEEADQDGAMDPVTEAADEEEAEGEMGSTEDSAMNTVTEITDQEKEDRYTDEKDDSVMDLVNEVTDQDEANQDTGEKEDATNDPIIEISHRNEQDMGQSEDSGMDPVNEVTDQEDVDQETDEKEVSAADPIGPQVESFSASPTETTTSATVSTGEAVPVSEATKRQNMIETELNGMIKEMMDSEDFQEEDEMEPESYEAIMKAAKEICYTRKIYDVSADKIVFFPSITKTIVNMDLFEKAEEYYYDEGDEFPMEYSMGLRNVAFEKLEAEGEDDDDEEMDDDMMERLSMAVQLTEDDKDELQEAIAAAEAADKEEADQDGAMDPVTEAADEEEAEGEMGSTEDSAMNTVTEITDQEKEDRYTDEKDDSVMDLVNEVTDQDEADQSTDENELSAIDAISPKEETDKDIDEDKEDSAIDTVNEVSDPKEADNDVDEDKEDSAIDTVTKPADQDVVQDIDKKEDCAMDTVTEVIDQEETDKDIDNKADSAIDPIIGAAYSEEADQDIDNKELSVIDPTSPQLEASSKALANSDLVEAKLTDEGSEAKIDKLDRPPDRSIVPESVPEQDYLVSKATTKKILSTHRVISSGAGLILFGMTGFYTIPGMIADGAEGSKLVNSFYCSVMSLTTVGFGDICPGETDVVGRIFLTMLPLFGLGFFCGPIMELASSWQNMVPGGALSVGTLMLVMGVSMLTTIEGLSYSEAVHLCVITGTTIGYGDLTPRTNAGRFFLALYAIANCNVMGGFLGQVRELLESLCAVKDPDVPSGASKRKASRPTASPEEIAAFDKEKVL